MLVSEEALLEKYFPFDIPVPYKDWHIYAIKMRDSYDVNDAIGILSMDKNTLGEADFIMMSNLRFCMLFVSSDPTYKESFESLLRVALDISDEESFRYYVNDDTEYIEVGVSVGQTRGGYPILKEGTIRVITAEDFDEIKRVILFSVDIDYTDDYVDPDVRKMTDEYFRLKSQGKSVPLEHKVLCLRMATGMNGEEVGNLSIRNFYQLYNIMVGESEYSACRLAESMGAKFSKPLEHWAYSAHKNKYTEAFVDADSFTSYVQSAN